MDLQKELFGRTNQGEEASLFTLSNEHNVTVKITNYGGIITAILAPDQNGAVADVALGLKTLAEYQKPHPYFGALVGRYGNRIAKGRFTLDGAIYQLAVNDGRNHLHGGLVGFDKVLWRAREIHTGATVGVALRYVSADGEEGYPGNLQVEVKYILNNQNELTLEYSARTDRPTVVNLTNHSYFNLSGEGRGDILGQIMRINADYITAVDAELIPTGDLAAVAGTPWDFTKARAIGARFAAVEGGYDHNYVLNRQAPGLRLAAKAEDPQSGRILEVSTTAPGVQFYTGNFLDGTIQGKSGQFYGPQSGFCLETQAYPDSPNHPEFPSTRLNPDETYHQTTVYKFAVRN
ncbi:MAG: aldose epimerase family protein [Bacillota bacterium]|jgi:aldose 1-epimerase